MKKNLIRLSLFLLIPLEIFASSYQWHASASRELAFVNEAIHLSYVCEFSDSAEIYAVAFDPIKSNENITIEVLSETSRIEDSKKILQYDFVAFVHRAGEHTFAFSADMKKTTKESIENTIIGRDNGKYAEYEITEVALSPLKVDVVETNSTLAGEFALSVKRSGSRAEAFIPYHVELIIEGAGNFNAIEPVAFEIAGVRVFSEEPKKDFTLTPEGYKGRWSQKFAFVAQHDFRIEPFEILYFDTKMQQIKELHFEGISVTVEAGIEKETLLDEEPQKRALFEWEYLYYILSFVAGFLVSKIKWRKKEPQVQQSFCKKIKNAPSLEALSMTLVIKDADKYETILRQIEQKELTSLSKAKRLICALKEFQ